MLKTIIPCIFVWSILTIGSVNAQSIDTRPKNIHLVYEVIRNGQPFANVTESYKQSDNQYHIVSVTKGIGVYALLGERRLMSDGTVTAQGLKPVHFELRQGDNAKKWLTTDFDWANNTLNMTVKGVVRTVPLIAGTQDLASFPYQFMSMSLDKMLAESKGQADVTLNVTTGKKLQVYVYKAAVQDSVMGLPAGKFKTIQLSSLKENAADDNKQIWLAADQYYLPVRITTHDENGAIEQSLKSLQFE